MTEAPAVTELVGYIARLESIIKQGSCLLARVAVYLSNKSRCYSSHCHHYGRYHVPAVCEVLYGCHEYTATCHQGVWIQPVQITPPHIPRQCRWGSQALFRPQSAEHPASRPFSRHLDTHGEMKVEVDMQNCFVWDVQEYCFVKRQSSSPYKTGIAPNNPAECRWLKDWRTVSSLCKWDLFAPSQLASRNCSSSCWGMAATRARIQYKDVILPVYGILL